MPLSYSGTRFAGWYFSAQAVVIASWWLALGLVPQARRYFVPPGAGELDLLAFAVSDLVVAAPVSLVAGWSSFRQSAWAQPLGWVAAGTMVYSFFYCVGWSWLREGGWLNVALMAPAALLSTVAALDGSPRLAPIFRKATPGSAPRHVVATLSQIVVLWSFFLFVVPRGIRWVETQIGLPGFSCWGQRPLAAILFVAFSALGLASGMAIASRGDGTPLPFDSPNRLVVTGPYAYVRNPMVIAGLGQGLSVGLWTGSWAVLAYVVTGGLIWQFLVRPAEERDLQDHFGDDYSQYRTRVRCWLPRS